MMSVELKQIKVGTSNNNLSVVAYLLWKNLEVGYHILHEWNPHTI